MRIGVLGGGQLGRMLALAGYPLGLDFRFFDPNSGAPVGQIGELVAARYDDEIALTRFLKDVDVVTYEFESIPLAAVEFVAARVPVYPPVEALAVAQDRLLEKQLFQKLGIPVPPFAAIDSRDDLSKAEREVGFPCVLKTRRFGYDGKGQMVLRRAADVDGAWATLGGVPLILEKFVTFEREVSAIGARDQSGNEVHYPVSENHHHEGILRRTVAPAPKLPAALAVLAMEYNRRILKELHYIGVLALELFQAGGALLANEMAPRVHNSGHWTIEGSETSQFENHLRAITGLPLGPTAMKGEVVMLNVIGMTPSLAECLSVEGAHVHLYGKAPTERRKVGHVTLVADSLDALGEREKAIASLLQTNHTPPLSHP